MIKGGSHFITWDWPFYMVQQNKYNEWSYIQYGSFFSKGVWKAYIEKCCFLNVINLFFISVSMEENRKFLVLTLTAPNIPLIKCCRHKNFKDLMYRSPNMRKIWFKNADFCNGGYLFPSENAVTEALWSSFSEKWSPLIILGHRSDFLNQTTFDRTKKHPV